MDVAGNLLMYSAFAGLYYANRIPRAYNFAKRVAKPFIGYAGLAKAAAFLPKISDSEPETNRPVGGGVDSFSYLRKRVRAQIGDSPPTTRAPLTAPPIKPAAVNQGPPAVTGARTHFPVYHPGVYQNLTRRSRVFTKWPSRGKRFGSVRRFARGVRRRRRFVR